MMGDLQAVILAGGQGTRLQSIVKNEPKAMASIAGRPFIDWMLSALRQSGIRRVVLCTGYLAAVLREYVADGRKWDMSVVHSEEPEPLGTGGALRYALPVIDSDLLLVLNGDSWCDADLSAFMAWHHERKSNASILLTWVKDCARFGTVEVDGQFRIQCFIEKTGQHNAGWINAGIYLLRRSLLSAIQPNRMVSIERDVFPGLVPAGLYGFQARAPFIDIGTPESYIESHEFFQRTLATAQEETQ